MELGKVDPADREHSQSGQSARQPVGGLEDPGVIDVIVRLVDEYEKHVEIRSFESLQSSTSTSLAIRWADISVATSSASTPRTTTCTE